MPSPGGTGFHLVVIPDYGEVIDLAFDGEKEFRSVVTEYLEAFKRREFRGVIRLYVGERTAVPESMGVYQWQDGVKPVKPVVPGWPVGRSRR